MKLLVISKLKLYALCLVAGWMDGFSGFQSSPSSYSSNGCLFLAVLLYAACVAVSVSVFL